VSSVNADAGDSTEASQVKAAPTGEEDVPAPAATDDGCSAVNAAGISSYRTRKVRWDGWTY
jgi:hypothetical protein